jgi:hypothetical protein
MDTAAQMVEVVRIAKDSLDGSPPLGKGLTDKDRIEVVKVLSYDPA